MKFDLMNKIMRLFHKRLHKKLTPSNLRHSDIFLVEFPKSGITWLSFLIANSLIKSDAEHVTFYNQHKFVVDVHQLRSASISNDCFLSGTRFIKSHSNYNSEYYFVIYILRNPFDVMLSYYYFTKSLGYKKNFSQFIKSKDFGIENWVKHIESWLINNKDYAQRIHLIKFENLVSNTKSELFNLFNNIGIKVDHGKIERAIELSSKKRMKESEYLYSSFNPVYKNTDMSFIRKGEVMQNDKILSEEIRNYILKKSSHILKEFYCDLYK